MRDIFQGQLARRSADQVDVPEPSSAARIAAVRLLAWLGVSAVAAASFRDASAWTWVVPLCVAGYVGARAGLAARTSGVGALVLADACIPLAGSTLLIALTGGFGSPFAALYFLNVAEGVAIRGATGGVEMAIGAAVLGLVHLRSGVGPQAALALGFSAGLLVLAALILRLSGVEAEGGRTVLKQRTVEELDRQLETLGEQHHRLRASYRDLAAAAREQRERIQDVSAGQSILAASAEVDEEDVVYECILQALAKALSARGAVLWLADPSGALLRVRGCFGAVAPVVAESPIPFLAGMQATDARRACEERLRLSARTPSAKRGEPKAAHKDVVDLAPSDRQEILGLALRHADDLVGVVALCGAEGGAFTGEQADSLNDLRDAVSLALRNVSERTRLRNGVREIGLLHELSGLARSAADLNAVCEGALAAAQRYVAFENATLFLLDVRAGRLLPRATRGQTVNLIDHISFETGNGLSGWVAQKRKVLTIADVLDEKGLLNVELIPPDVRSFVALPLLVHDRVLGVLNLSHSRPHAFSPEDIRLASVVAGQTALTLMETEELRRDEMSAIVDPLTGVMTRRHFRYRLEEELRRAERYGIPATLVLIDVDHMAQVNLDHGTAAGDGVLAEIGRILRRHLRAADLVGRYGGDAFAVLLTQTACVDGLYAVQRIARLVAESEMGGAARPSPSVTTSVAVAAYPDDGSTMDALTAKATAAVAEAKAQGGNTVRRA